MQLISISILASISNIPLESFFFQIYAFSIIHSNFNSVIYVSTCTHVMCVSIFIHKLLRVGAHSRGVSVLFLQSSRGEIDSIPRAYEVHVRFC